MIKRMLFLLTVLAVGLSAAASGPEAVFEETAHDFGTIKATGGPVSCEYKVTNTGTEPLIIISVTNGGCGCTTPSFPKEPIAPGKTGTIKITFNPVGRRGEFNRQVKVRTNAASKRESLRFNGVIVP